MHRSRRIQVQLISLMIVASVALSSSKSYAQDPITLTEIVTDGWWVIDKLQKGYSIYNTLKGIFDPDPSTAALIAKAVSDLETFYVDETVRGYFDTANGTVLPAYAAAISKPSATSWQTFDSEAYSLIVSLYSAMTTPSPKIDLYSHELAGLYNTILPLYLAVHLNGARWGIALRSSTSKTLLDDVVETAKNAIALDYKLVGSKARWTYGSNSTTLPDDIRQSVLFKYIQANYDNGSSDDLCAAFFQTDATVQAVQIGGLGIYKTLAYSAQNTGGAQNMDLVVDNASGVTVRLDPDTSWGHNWAGYQNAVWTPMYHNNNGQWVTGRSCPRDCGIVAMWNVPYDPWHVGFLCQKWPAAPAWTTNAAEIYQPQSGVHDAGGGFAALEYQCADPYFMAGAADTDNFLCRYRVDGNTPIPSQVLPVQEMDLYGMSVPPTGIINALPGGNYLVGADYAGYSKANVIFYYYTQVKFPSGFGSPEDAWNQGTVFPPQSNSQHYPQDFSIFALKSVTGIQDVRGPVAAGGDVTASSFRINSDSKMTVGLAVGGNLKLNYGTVVGLTRCDGTATIDPSVNLQGKVGQGTLIDYQEAFTALKGMSTALSQFPATGSVSTNYSTITLASTDPNFEVFSLSADALSKATSIQCFFQPNATVVINVSGSGVSLQNMGMSAWKSGTPPKQTTFNWSHIIWNFYEATSLVTSSVTIAGSILAPLADAHLQWGQVSGTLVASSVVTSSEFYWAPFENNLLVGP